MTGITRISKESIFSDLNNPRVISTTTDSYTASFGFTRDEVESSLKEYGLEDRLQEVQDWYDGFTYGKAAYGLMLTNREVKPGERVLIRSGGLELCVADQEKREK